MGNVKGGYVVSKVLRNAEIKMRTTSDIKRDAKQIYSNWGLSLSDAINIFLVKSIEVGGLPFEMRKPRVDNNKLRKHACVPKFDSEGIAVLPQGWDDE